MDILHLVDRLEEILNQARPLPFTHNVIVDEDRILDLIDQMRVAIPEEVKKSQQLLAQRDRMLAQAQEEANRTLAIAREKSEQLVERDAIVQAAQARAERMTTLSKPSPVLKWSLIAISPRLEMVSEPYNRIKLEVWKKLRPN